MENYLLKLFKQLQYSRLNHKTSLKGKKKEHTFWDTQFNWKVNKQVKKNILKYLIF